MNLAPHRNRFTRLRRRAHSLTVQLASSRALPLATAGALTLALLLPASASADYRNGVRFDPGREMSARAEGAPAELDKVTGFLGQWDVEIVRPQAEGDPRKATGTAEITFMNRGHALMENLYSQNLYSQGLDGFEFSALQFLGFNPASGRWFLAGADNEDERAWVADGGFAGNALVFTDARRLRGGVVLTWIRYSLAQPGPDALHMKIESSTDGGATFSTFEERTYSRREASTDFMKEHSTHGVPASDRFPGADAFDFLIGEWNASHSMTFPNGQSAQWISNNTGVYALNGSAVMEFNWFDTDPNLPDAATTIVRLYNRGARRWESLFVPNRGHAVLHFGGVQEGDEIVLHPFEGGATGQMSRWVFHGIEKDSYSWYGANSTDRGKTWTRTWVIEVERKAAEAEGDG